MRALTAKSNITNRNQLHTLRIMSSKPIRRYYASGYTFRWVKGESIIAVKPGYVIEGTAFIVRPSRVNTINDRPHEDPATDRHTWARAIPANPTTWDSATALVQHAKQWLRQNNLQQGS